MYPGMVSIVALQVQWLLPLQNSAHFPQPKVVIFMVKFRGEVLTRHGIALSRRVQVWHFIKSVPCRRHAAFRPTVLHFVTTLLDYVKLNYSRLDSFQNHSDTCQEHSSNYRHRLQRVVLDKRRFKYSDTTWHLCLPQKPWIWRSCQGGSFTFRVEVDTDLSSVYG